MKRLIGVFAFSLAFSGIANCQITQEIRKEFDLKETDATSVLVVGKKGLITHGTHKDRGEAPVLQINLFDTDLELQSTVEAQTMSKSYVSRNVWSSDSSKIYFFQQAKNRDILINVYSVDDQKIQTYNHKMETAFYPSSITEINGTLVLYGTSSKKAAFVCLNPASGTQTMTFLPGVNKKRYLESFVRDESGNSITVLYRDGSDMKKSTIFLTILDAEGNLTDPIELDRDMNYSIIDGTITWLGPTDFILAGTYGTKNNSAASGMYVSKWSNFQQEFITYHSFTDFEKFYDYLPARQQARVEKKAEKKKQKGKEDFIKTLVTIHPALMLDNSFAVVGEVYHATYRTETTTTYVNGRPTTTTRQVFDGYQYTHAVVMGVDFEGNLEYDHCFAMWMFEKPFSPRRNLRITSDDNTMDILFCNGSSISATTIDGDEIATKEIGKITSEVEGDIKAATYGASSQYWYDNFYIVYCFQRIKNKTNEDVDKKRNVFVLNKVEYSE